MSWMSQCLVGSTEHPPRQNRAADIDALLNDMNVWDEDFKRACGYYPPGSPLEFVATHIETPDPLEVGR